jgi:hypothetical protein
MSQLIVQEEQIKNLVKEAILELVREQREVLYDALAEVIEDLALAQAIKRVNPPRQQAGQRFSRSWRA